MAFSSKSSKSAEKHSECNTRNAPLLGLLLNTETKGEEEEFLDYYFPEGDLDLQSVLPMKGVLLASCGVLKAAVGQDVTFFTFYSIDGVRSYKASICRVESWVLCIILPAFARDGILRFFVNEALGLVALRHGRLSTLRGNFGQLDRIFRMLSGLWIKAAMDLEGHLDAPQMYVSLGMVFWSPLADTWKEEIRERISEWQSRWESMVLPDQVSQKPALARPEGFAVFLDHTLIATSLLDNAFEACLRLCYLEGAWDPCPTSEQQRNTSEETGCSARKSLAVDESCEVWCHSMFLRQDSIGATALPSHQYSIIQRGPWLLFMLWEMSAGTPDSNTSPEPSKAIASTSLESEAVRAPTAMAQISSDPFGIDLCIDLLLSLPLPVGCVDQADSQAALSSLGGTSEKKRSKSIASISNASALSPPKGKAKKKKHFALPCPLWNPLVRQKTRHKTSELDKTSFIPLPRTFFYALSLQEYEERQESPQAGFCIMREPSHAIKDHFSDTDEMKCPEMLVCASSRLTCEWAPWGMRTLFSESGDLFRLLQEHSHRRTSWMEAPSTKLTSHVLLGVLRGKNSLDKVWEECSDECLAEAAYEQPRRTEAVKMGCGESWRFQKGAPFNLSDISPVTSAGMLKSVGSSAAWVAITSVNSTTHDTFENKHKAIVFLDDLG